MKSIFSLSVFVLIVCCNCMEEEKKEIDMQPPEVEIHSPENNFFYEQGDTVFIKASFSDNISLRKVSVHIHDLFEPFGKDTVFVHDIIFIKKSILTEVDTFWIVNDPLDKNYAIYFDAIDQAENLTDKLQNFYQYH